LIDRHQGARRQPDCNARRQQTAPDPQRRAAEPGVAATRSSALVETYCELMRRQGISRRSFVKFCSLTAASLGLGEAGAQQAQQAMQTKPRTPVVWLEGLEYTCCSESFIRSSHPLAKDVVLSMLSLDHHMTLSAAAGEQLRANAHETIEKHKGNYILAVEGNPALGEDGMYCV
jgi:hydrogenase small subunit